MSPLPQLFPTTRARLVQVGYWIRPFDMLADRRRWCWQRRTRCGQPVGLADAIRQAIEQGDAEYLQWRAEDPKAAARWETRVAEVEAMRRRLR